MIRAYMFSFLVRQQLVLAQRFTQRYPKPWLVWEPGVWKVAPPNPSVLETQLPDRRLGKTPRDTDALCFELPLKPSATLRVGRADTNDIILSDLTVSREHCSLRVEGTRWVVRASPTVKSLIVAGLPQTPVSDATLLSGDVIQLGDVRLTFLDPAAFAKRVAAAADALERTAKAP